MAHPSLQRRIRLIRPRLQARLVLSFVGVAALAMLMQMMLVGANLTGLANELPSVGDELSEHLPGLLTGVFLWSSVLFLPLMLWIGVQKTFKVAGPIARFELYLADVRDGRATKPCQIRKTDELHELCKLINEALEATAARATHQAPEAASAKRAS